MNAEKSGVARSQETEIFYPEIMPDSWGRQYEGLKVARPKDGVEKLYGVEKESGRKVELPWRVLERAIEETYGFTPQKWTQEEYGQNPEVANVVIENSRLTAELNLCKQADQQNESKINELTAQVEQLSDSNQEYRQQIRSLVREVAQLNDRLSELERGRETVEPPVAEPQAASLSSSQWDLPPLEMTGQQPTATEAGGPSDATPTNDTDRGVAPRVHAEPATSLGWRDRLKSRWNRTTGSIGGAVLGWQVRGQNGVYRALDRRGREVVIQEEVVDGHPESERRVGAVILLGGVALVGAGVVGYLIGKHTGHDYGHELSEIVNQNNVLKDQHAELINKTTHLQTVAEHNSGIIDHLNNQVNHSTKVIDGLKDQVDSLKHGINKDIHLDQQLLGRHSAGTNSTGNKNFYVERGSGIIREIQEYARGRGRSVSDNKAYEIYSQLKSHFGRHIINIDGTSHNTYMVGSDIRLSKPGSAQWFPRAGSMLNKLLQK